MHQLEYTPPATTLFPLAPYRPPEQAPVKYDPPRATPIRPPCPEPDVIEAVYKVVPSKPAAPKPTRDEKAAVTRYARAKVVVKDSRLYMVESYLENGKFADAYAEIVKLETVLARVKPLTKSLIGWKFTKDGDA